MIVDFPKMEVSLSEKLGIYLYENYRSKFSSNLQFALTCGVDEKTIRILQQGKYNMSVNKLKSICDALDIKISDVLRDLGE